MFTLADNSLFYKGFHTSQGSGRIDECTAPRDRFTKWFSFGERMMGFNQWALLNDYPRGTTHPLDEAHEDAVQLMLPTFNKLYRRENNVRLDKKSLIHKIKQESSTGRD
jgi:hypothetical protein